MIDAEDDCGGYLPRILAHLGQPSTAVRRAAGSFAIAARIELCHRREMAKQHYLALDGFRGIAALCVLIYHLDFALQGPQLFPHAWLAVDFFFMLSGFVLMHAYKDRLAESMTFKAFMWARVKRLWPLILLGSAIAPLPVLLYEPEIASPVKLAALSSFSVMLLPVPKPTAFAASTFPLNVPLWSLSFEMLASLFFGVWARKPRRWTPMAVALLSFIALVVFALAGGNLESAGFRADLTFLLGIPRIGLPFALGMLLYRAQAPERDLSGGFLALSALLMVAFSVPEVRVFGWAYDLAAIMASFPFLILVAAKLRMSHWEEKIGEFLAELSYPVYVLHWPLLMLAKGSTTTRSPSFYIATVLAICGLSWAALKFFDEPVRKWLSARRRQKAL